MQHQRRRQLFRRLDMGMGRHEGRAGNRYQPFIQELDGMYIAISAGVESDRGLDLLLLHANAVQVMEFTLHPQAEVGVPGQQVRHPRGQPHQGE